MITTTILEFRERVKDYTDSVIESRETVLINRSVKGAVLVSLEKYNVLVQTASVL